jgi:hypothetical protein
MTQTTTSPQPVLPADVTAFAAERGVADCLLPVWAMAQRVFPAAPITIQLEEDAEITDWWYILLDVDVTGWNEQQILAAQQQWTASLFQHCPATHVHLFQIGLWASA